MMQPINPMRFFPYTYSSQMYMSDTEDAFVSAFIQPALDGHNDMYAKVIRKDNDDERIFCIHDFMDNYDVFDKETRKDIMELLFAIWLIADDIDTDKHYEVLTIYDLYGFPIIDSDGHPFKTIYYPGTLELANANSLEDAKSLFSMTPEQKRLYKESL